MGGWGLSNVHVVADKVSYGICVRKEKDEMGGRVWIFVHIGEQNSGLADFASYLATRDLNLT